MRTLTTHGNAVTGSPAPELPLRLSPKLALAAAFLLLRLGYLAFANLIPEEAYYWNYARHLDIGYLDHPPLVAWLIYAGTAVCGNTEFGVRIFALVASIVTSLFVFRLTELLYGRQAAATAVLLAQVLPFFFMTGFVMTPDSPLTACWAGTLYYLACVIFRAETRAWAGVGVCLGLGMLSKYTIALLGPATLLFLALDADSRFWFRRAAPYMAAAGALAIFSPAVLWNARHHWASFAFQSTGRVRERRRFSPHELAASILILLTPAGVILAGRALFGAAADVSARQRLFLRVFTLAPLAVFLAFSLVHHVKLNWTGPLWLAALPAIAAQIVAGGRGAWPRRIWQGTVLVMGVLYVLMLQYCAFGLPGIGYRAATELLPVGWPELGRELARQEDAIGGPAPRRTLIVGLDRNFIASEAAFYVPDQAQGVRDVTGRHLFGGESLMYAHWLPAREADGATLLLVSFERANLEERGIAKRCARLDPIREYWLRRGGQVIRPFYTRVAHDYRAFGRKRASGNPAG